MGRADERTFRVPLEQLQFKRNPPAGMNPYVIMGLVPLLKGSTEDHEPILVRQDGDHWLVLDGRHRFVASLIAGRPDVLAVEEQPEGV